MRKKALIACLPAVIIAIVLVVLYVNKKLSEKKELELIETN